MAERSIGIKFEELIADILDRHSYNFRKEVPVGDFVADLVLDSGVGPSVACEIKLFRTDTAPSQQLLKAASILESMRRELSADAALLLVGNNVSEHTIQLLESQYPKVILYDLGMITYLTKGHRDLSERLQAVVSSALIYSDNLNLNPKKAELRKDIESIKGLGGLLSSLVIEQPGKEIISKIRALDSGPDTASEYEILCFDALQYIFKYDLAAWNVRRKTDDGISIYDAIARVNSPEAFLEINCNRF